MNRQIARLALVGARPARRRSSSRRRTGRPGRPRPRRPAGQRDPARRAVHDQARARSARPTGTILATNRKKRVGGQTLYFRRYPQRGLAAHVVGYSTQSRSRTGLERSMNDYLTGSNANLTTVLDTTLDRLKGATIKGNDLVPDARPGARSASPMQRSAGTCGAVVALEPATGRGARDGLVADLRPEPGREATSRDHDDPRRLQRPRRRSSTARPPASSRPARRSRS